ncbi:hypothetical protein BGZ95_011667 [Linnemannia exigua]|uniref:Cyclin N-terminal domain-containing protein n=1 Tax=Linnemannia exigua TaxID=604196 RepID=A0AAD4DJY2_9FUNG|nr:hypothetical protein BGZ95_011667 [Linnemannia exigua]
MPTATNSNSTTATAAAATASTINPIAPSSAASSSASTPAASVSTLANYAEEGTPCSGSTSLQTQPHQQMHGSHSTGAAPPEQSPLQPQQDNPIHAARLISLANYIRHIISLSSGNSPFHSQSTLIQQRLLLVQRQQQQLRQQQKLQESRPAWATANRLQQDSASLPSPLSAGPGPMKNNSLSARKHRQTSEYHDHAARRQHHHHQQQQQQQQQMQTSAPFVLTSVVQDPLPSPTSPIFQVIHRSSQPQQQLHNAGNEQPAAAGAGSKLALTLPKVPFPNLTLTLALIYVDRLKEKNPAAKGEPGCSHRLFLVAYIIAAKYRCSVELAALLQEQYRSDASTTSSSDEEESDNGEVVDKSAIGGVSNSNINISCSSEEEKAKSIDRRISEARSRAEVILSNQAWVQLLSLGSFMRPITPASITTKNNNATAAESTMTSPSQPINRSIVSNATGTLELGSAVEAKPLPIQSLPSTTDETTITHGAEQTQTVSPPSSNSTSPSTALPPQSPLSSILQVEDLNRMESEFLTFLDYDLAARSQDLDTCWSLLVGNKAI